MALVEHEIGALAEHLQIASRRIHRLFDVGDAGVDGIQLDELAVRLGSNDVGERRLSAAGRAPEDTAAQAVEGDGAAQERAFRDEMLLPDKFFERACAHALGERFRLFFVVVEIKQIHLAEAP